MSQENVELVRKIYDAWRTGESARDLISPEVEYVNPPYAVEPGTRTGRAAFRGIRDAYTDVTIEPHTMVDAGDCVLVEATLRGTSHGGRVPIAVDHWYVWRITDGVASRFHWFASEAEALEAAGLSE